MVDRKPEESGDLAVLTRLLGTRYSCRGFSPDPLPQDTIRQILTAAQRTASWCNLQPWNVVVTGGEETRRFAAALYDWAQMGEQVFEYAVPSCYEGVYQERRRGCGLQLYGALGIARADMDGRRSQELENYRLFGAPHVAIISCDAALQTYGAIDCGAYVSTFMLAAQSVGISSIAQAALASYPDFVRGYFGLGPEQRIVCGISFGYEAPDHPANAFRTMREAVDDAVDWRGFDAATD